MFSDLAAIRAELKDRLEPLLDGFRIVDNMSESANTVVPVLYFEYIGIMSSVDGQALPRSTVAANIKLTLASAGSGDEDGADELILTLTHALQRFSDIYWDTATKIRLANGPFAWELPLTILSTITPADTEE